MLIADAQSGTAINPDPQLWPGLAGRTLPVMWPEGFTGRSLFGGEVEVLNAAGEHVVTTGTRVVLGLQAEAPFEGGPYPACEGREVTGPRDNASDRLPSRSRCWCCWQAALAGRSSS